LKSVVEEKENGLVHISATNDLRVKTFDCFGNWHFWLATGLSAFTILDFSFSLCLTPSD